MIGNRISPTPYPATSLSRALAAVVSVALALAASVMPALAGARPAAPASPGASTDFHRVAVFGEDGRMLPPPELGEIALSLGLLFDPRSRSVCTAFCVADAVIATAAHCLYRFAGRNAPRPADFWFARNFERARAMSRIEGHASGSAATAIVAGTERVSTEPPITATRDWALVRLARPVCKGRGLPVARASQQELAGIAAAGHFFQLSYHRDFQQWRVAYSRPCALLAPSAEDAAAAQSEFSSPEQLLLHQCDTGGASSGSPLLIDRGGRFAVVGINVGTYVQSRSLLQNGEVVRRLEPETVANTGVAASAFADRVPALAGAKLISSREDVRRLQRQLSARGYNAGPADGVFRESLRAAIERYEAAEGLPVTGIAGRELLQRVSRP